MSGTIHRPPRFERPPKRKYVHSFQDDTGLWRHYFRPGKGMVSKPGPLPGQPGEPQFEREYQNALAGKLTHKATAAGSPDKKGSVDSAVKDFFRSSLWNSWKGPTHATRRPILLAFCERRDKKGVRHGDKQIKGIEWRHVDRWIGELRDKPGAAYNLLYALRGLFTYCIKAKLRSDDPTQGVKRPAKKPGRGWHTWTDDELAHYEKMYPVGTKRRRAYALAYYTTARANTIRQLGPQHIVGNRLEFVPTKTDNSTQTALSLPMHPELAREVKQSPPEDLTFLLTDHGVPFSSHLLSAWFKAGCKQIGLGHCSIHGIRKAACRVMAERGASTKQIASFTGHASLSSLEIYVKDAEQKQLADGGVAFLSRKSHKSKGSNPEQRG